LAAIGSAVVAPSERALEVGIVGVGQVATEAHLPVLLGIPDVCVAWIVDKNDDKAALVAKAIGIRPTRLPPDPGHLPHVDVALLAIPYGARLPYYEAFGARGIAVYAEKPFAASRAEHDRLTRLFHPNRLGCGYQRRSSAAVRRLRDVAAAELFGPLLSARVEYGGPGTRGGNYYSDLGLAGGGILFEVGVHALDAVLFVSRAADVRVTSVRMVREQGFDIHTEATIDVDRTGGETFTLEVLVSSLQFTAMTNVYTFEHATLAHAVVEEGDPLWVSSAGEDGQRYRLEGDLPEYPRTNAQQLNEHWSHFLEAVRSGRANYTNASATALTSSLIGQLYEG
jgi:predicted dehydrogenase